METNQRNTNRVLILCNLLKLSQLIIVDLPFILRLLFTTSSSFNDIINLIFLPKLTHTGYGRFWNWIRVNMEERAQVNYYYRLERHEEMEISNRIRRIFDVNHVERRAIEKSKTQMLIWNAYGENDVNFLCLFFSTKWEHTKGAPNFYLRSTQISIISLCNQIFVLLKTFLFLILFLWFLLFYYWTF